MAIESLRSLRTSLQFALFEARNNVVAITGPSPGVGKTFISANLAHVLASPERRVLLVDCDLRRGSVHRSVGVQRQPGVSDVVSGGVALVSEAVRHTAHPQLHVLPAGRVPPNPAELLASHAFARLVSWASSNYDLVLIDTPPALAVTDAMEVARLAGVNLIVLRAGHHSIREIRAAVKRYAQAGLRLHGAVLNDVRATFGRYGRHGRYQRYEYRTSQKDRRSGR
jgi:tyrosine-protein kinase Etk/Wzc